jgi:ribosomal protein L11 methyltransferase
MSTWLLVTARFAAPQEDWARITEVFASYGIEGTVQADSPPSLGGYLWQPRPEALYRLREALFEAGAKIVAAKAIHEEDWSEIWKRHFVPRRAGERFVVLPAWDHAEPRDGELHIALDPGQAFGTGDHPTTRLCLELLESLPVQGARVADIGCGTGVLSIGCALLGAGEVHACDIEAVAVAATSANAKLNGVSVLAWEGAGFEPLPEGHYDIVVGNLISATLMRIAPEVASRLKPGGWWVVSGVIEANWPDVAEAARRSGFALNRLLREGDWVAADFRL